MFFVHEVLSDTIHSHEHLEYVYAMLLVLGGSLVADPKKGQVQFYGCLFLCALFFIGGFFHLPKLFYVLPATVFLMIIGTWIIDRWQAWQRFKQPALVPETPRN